MKRENKRLLAVFAHPDDESFFVGGSLAKAARAGVKIHLITATRGEDGEWYDNTFVAEETPELPRHIKSAQRERRLSETRVRELAEAVKILGLERVDYLSYVDGCLCNRDLPAITAAVEKKLAEFKPQVVLTFDRLGISGHIDHIIMARAASCAVKKQKSVERLYYWTVSPAIVKVVNKLKPGQFELTDNDFPLIKYNISDTWNLRKKAIQAHKTQKADWQRLMLLLDVLPKEEYYKLAIVRKPAKLDGIPFF